MSVSNKKNIFIIKLSLFSISILMCLYVSWISKVMPSGFFAFASSNYTSTRFFWWSWPVLWITAAHIYTIKRRTISSHSNPTVDILGVIGILMIIRIIFLLPILSIYSDMVSYLPIVDQKFHPYHIRLMSDWKFLMGAVNPSIPFVNQLLNWLIGITTIIVYIWFLSPIEINRKIQNLLTMIFSVICIQIVASMGYILLICFFMFSIALATGFLGEVGYEKYKNQRS